MSLKEATKDNHTRAERQPFVKILFSGNVDPTLYAQYLKNQYQCYAILETCAMDHEIFKELPDFRRAPLIDADFKELWGEDNEELPVQLPVIEDYSNYIMSIKDDPEKLMAHVYVRHLGDLAGGQMISKRVPGHGKYYQFEDADLLKTAIRERINDNMADEANLCFEYAIQLFDEMMTLVDHE